MFGTDGLSSPVAIQNGAPYTIQDTLLPPNVVGTAIVNIPTCTNSVFVASVDYDCASNTITANLDGIPGNYDISPTIGPVVVPGPIQIVSGTAYTIQDTDSNVVGEILVNITPCPPNPLTGLVMTSVVYDCLAQTSTLTLYSELGGIFTLANIDNDYSVQIIADTTATVPGVVSGTYNISGPNAGGSLVIDIPTCNTNGLIVTSIVYDCETNETTLGVSTLIPGDYTLRNINNPGSIALNGVPLYPDSADYIVPSGNYNIDIDINADPVTIGTLNLDIPTCCVLLAAPDATFSQDPLTGDIQLDITPIVDPPPGTTYEYSLDGGATWNPASALPLTNNITTGNLGAFSNGGIQVRATSPPDVGDVDRLSPMILPYIPTAVTVIVTGPNYIIQGSGQIGGTITLQSSVDLITWVDVAGQVGIPIDDYGNFLLTVPQADITLGLNYRLLMSGTELFQGTVPILFPSTSATGITTSSGIVTPIGGGSIPVLNICGIGAIGTVVTIVDQVPVPPGVVLDTIDPSTGAPIPPGATITISDVDGNWCIENIDLPGGSEAVILYNGFLSELLLLH